MFRYYFKRFVLTALLISPIAITQNHIQAQSNALSERSITDANTQFTQSMADALIDYGEFLAGDKFTSAQKAWLIKTETANFQNNPQKSSDYINKLNSGIFPEIEALESDSVRLIRYREKAFADIYLSRVENKILERQDFMTVVYQYIPVIFAKEELVVTMQDLDASTATNNFVRNINPVYNFESGDRSRRSELIKNLKRYFTSLDDEQQESIAYAESRWYALSWGWDNSSAEKKQDIAAEVALRAANGEKFSTIAHDLQDRFYYTAEEKAE